jgi:L-asparaginase
MMAPNILLIYTGGTIGMIADHKTGELKSLDFNYVFDHIPELARLNVTLSNISFDKAIDSSDMTHVHWQLLVQMIQENYHQYDGFVVLHGSDTMAFTASALSFMLQGLNKPVILTGSQLPIGTLRTDGKENLISAVEIAANKNFDGSATVQEVAIYFEYSLYRGNRCTKISANQFEAFSSPNFGVLALAGVTIDYRKELQLIQNNHGLKVYEKMETRIGLLKLYPSIPIHNYHFLFDFSLFKGLVIETFGAGNAPNNSVFESLINSYINAGGIVLNVTQCSSGAVKQGKYQTSSFFEKAGVVSGKDMTLEAAITKIMHVLGNYETKNAQLKQLNKNLAGEITI